MSSKPHSVNWLAAGGLLVALWAPFVLLMAVGSLAPPQRSEPAEAAADSKAPSPPAQGPTISTKPLSFGDGSRPEVLRPKSVTVYLRSGPEGEIRVLEGERLLGKIRRGADGAFSGSGFAAVMDRASFWRRTQVEIAREPSVPRLGLEAVAHALLTGGATQQTFRVLDE